jgi:dTDP-4-dehydrorhamnose reductase
MRILVTGALGQLGRELLEVFEADGGHEVIATDAVAGPDDPAEKLDITDRDAVRAAFAEATPDHVIHPAAMTAVDRCEDEVDLAYRINAIGTRNVAEAARSVGAQVLYVSTDYVFDGTKQGPYLEWDTPNPMSVYGASKLAGERELDPGSTVVRTSWVCGRYGQNMVKTILRVADQHPELSFVDDQFGHPTFASDLARMIHLLATERRPGTFHVTNQGAVSWFEFARAVLEADGADPDRVKPITTEQLQPPRPAPRPANSVLDNAALRLSGIELLPDFREPLARTVAWIREHGA